MTDEAPVAPADLRASLASYEAFVEFAKEFPHILTVKTCQEIVAHARMHGAKGGFLGDAAPEDINILDNNFRESLLAQGYNPRIRAMLDLIDELAVGRHPSTFKILAHEAVTPLALLLRGRFARCLCTEYAPTPEDQLAIFPIQHCDVQNSDLPSGVFDLVVSNDVFEHIPDLQAALVDCCRVLRPGGVLLATFPFAYGNSDTVVRARLVDGKVIYLMEPEFHGNPIKPQEGSLVFQVPGWDVIERARAAGFANAEMILWSSHERALTGAEIAGIFILRAVRSF